MQGCVFRGQSEEAAMMESAHSFYGLQVSNMRMRMRKREGETETGGWEVRFTYGTGGDSVYRLASDQSRESEEDDDVAIHFLIF